jgi:acetylornithine deacetylase/succinyl-diaminopimelate desuccinylase-like protein
VIDPREFVAADSERLLDEWARIALIPAPEGAETQRAALIAGLARESGADRVEVDRTGNVLAWVHGEHPHGETITFLATMDDLGSVAAHRRGSSRLERDGDRLVGPCVETTSSDASALAIIRYARSGARPWKTLLIAFVLGEETGLTGVRALVADHGAQLGSVIDLMGGIGTVSWNAIGFAGLEVRFAAEPRHSLYGGVSEVSDAIARFVLALHAEVPPTDDGATTVRRVNRVHAGSVFNHSPSSGTVSVDVRSTDPTALDRLEQQTRETAERAAAEAGVTATIGEGERQPAVALPGGREHRLVRSLAAAIRYAGYEPRLRPWSSSNINVVYAAGLAGVVHDGMDRGGGRGTADEWCNVPRVLAGVVADCRLLQQLTTD